MVGAQIFSEPPKKTDFLGTYIGVLELYNNIMYIFFVCIWWVLRARKTFFIKIHTSSERKFYNHPQEN